MPDSPFDSLQTFSSPTGPIGSFYSLPQLEKNGVGPISRLPHSIRVVLESVLRNCDGAKITEDDVRELANWQANGKRTEEIPFVVARVLLQDFTGVPLLVDLAAMRSAVARLRKNTGLIEPLVPVDLVIDHSVQVDLSSTRDAFEKNMEMEFRRNRSRYQFLKWGTQGFDGFRVIPPGIGARRPRSGDPPRTMPIPWPKPGCELGSTQAGARPTRVRALTDAPRAISSLTSSG